MTKKSDVVVKLGLMFLISVLSFAVGTFVGKKYSDNQYRISAMEPESNAHTNEHSERAVASDHADEHGTEAKGEMSNQEIAKLAEEFVADEEEGNDGHGKAKSSHEGDAHASADHDKIQEAKHDDAKSKQHESAQNAHASEDKQTPTHAESAKSKTDSHGEGLAAKPGAHATGSENHAVSNSKNVVAQSEHDPLASAHDLIDGKQSAPKEKKASRWPSSIPKDVANFSVGKFTVQVASFSSESEAKERAEDLKTKGYSAFYIPAEVKGQTWYRVSIGLFSTEKEAKEYRQEYLSKAKSSESALVQKITN